MQNSMDLSRVLKNFEKLLGESTRELQAKDKAFKDKEDETKKLKDDIDQAQRDIEAKRRQWSENERMLPRLRADAERARIKYKETLTQVENAKKTADEALKNQKKGYYKVL